MPIEGITSKIIFDKMKNENKRIVEDNELLDIVSNIDAEVILTVGAGDIDRFVLEIKNTLEKRK